MTGFLEQRVDWVGVDGAWYNLIKDDDLQLDARVTAPLSEEFPDRQLLTGFSLTYGKDKSSIVISVEDPYSTETQGCAAGISSPCLLDGALRIVVNGADSHELLVPTESNQLPEGAVISSASLPAACQSFGGDKIWANQFAQIGGRKLHVAAPMIIVDWIKTWSPSTAAPSWCDKFLDEQGVTALTDSSNHVVFRIEMPNLSVRLHIGTNYQGGKIIPDGRTLPELDFWQMNVHVEWLDVDVQTVSGILGGTMRPVLDAEGKAVMRGPGAIHGEIQDYRVPSPLTPESA